MSNISLFTSESVCAGHPDKICDAISDAILDKALEQDPNTRAGIETAVGANQITLLGEIKTNARLDYEKIARGTIARLGYTDPAWGFSAKESAFSNFVHEQSPEIAIGVDADGAGDQGVMFGYACSETPELMPLPITLAHELTKRIDEAREKKDLLWLRPDGKAQVTVRYEDSKPIAVEKIVIAVAHNKKVAIKEIKEGVIRQIIGPVLEKYQLALPAHKNITINGTGLWYIPGPRSDAGLTGRKIVVDGYGGYARVGGGAFSGKDPSKVDRSGAYAARYIAKNIVASGLAQCCEVALAYAIGRPDPLMQTIDTQGTAAVSQEVLGKYAKKLIDTSVKGICDKLKLNQAIYSETSAYGHFGKANLPWETLETN